MLFSLFRRKKNEKREDEADFRVTAKVVVSENEPFVLAFLSGKGGCGKSTIAANTVVLLSALYGKVVAIDMDITNASLTSMMFAITPDVLREDDGISTLDYIVEEAEKYSLYKLEFPPNKRFSIQVAGQKGVGVPVKDIYVLPAKKATVSYERNLSALAYLSKEEIRTSLVDLYTYIMRFTKKQGIRFVILDFPPLRPDQRKVYEGVFTLLEHIPNFIMVSSFDYSAIHGLIGILNQRYGYLKSRTLGFFINMSVPLQSVVNQIRGYIESIYGNNSVFFLRRDPRWSVTIVPPIILGDPSEGAHLDLIKAYVELGILDKQIVVSKLKFDPQSKSSIF